MAAASARITELEALLKTRRAEHASLQAELDVLQEHREAGPLTEREIKIRERMRLGGRSLSREQAVIAVDSQAAEDARRATETSRKKSK